MTYQEFINGYIRILPPKNIRQGQHMYILLVKNNKNKLADWIDSIMNLSNTTDSLDTTFFTILKRNWDKDFELDFKVPKGWEVVDNTPCVYTDYKSNICIFGYNVKAINTLEKESLLKEKIKLTESIVNTCNRIN